MPAGSVIDTESPLIVTADAANEFTVDVVFSEPVLPDIAFEDTEIRVVPELEILSRTLSSDGQTLQLITDEQQSGEPYQLTVSRLEDLNGNPVSDVGTSFIGGGELPDPTPPELLSPLVDQRLFTTSVTLTWAPRRKARLYTVEVSLQSDFSTLERTVDVEQSLVRLEGLAPVTHFWRVRADVTATDAELPTQRFDLMDPDVLYVWCAAGSTCEPTGHAGNLSDPHQSILTAIRDAASNGVPEIQIAVRGQGEAYEEQLALESGVNVRGGYAPNDFSVSTPSEIPIVRGTGAFVLTAQFVQGPITVERLRFENDTTLPSAAALSVVASEGLTFQEVQLLGPPSAAETSAAAVETSSDITFRNSNLSAPATSLRSTGLRTRLSSVRLEGTDVLAGAAVVSEAVQARDSSLEIVASFLESGEAVDRSIVIEASASTLSIEGSSLTAGSTDTSIISDTAGSYGIYATGDVVEGVTRPPVTVDLELRDSTIVTGAGSSSIGLWLVDGRALVEDNHVQTGAASVPWTIDSMGGFDQLEPILTSPYAASIGILLDGAGDWRLVENTVEAGPAAGWAAVDPLGGDASSSEVATRCENSVISAAVCLTTTLKAVLEVSCRAELRRNRLASSSATDVNDPSISFSLPGSAAYSAGVASFFNRCQLWALNNVSLASTARGVESSALSAGLLIGDGVFRSTFADGGLAQVMSSHNVFLGGSAMLPDDLPADSQLVGGSGGVLIYDNSLRLRFREDPNDPSSTRDADDDAFAFVNNIIGTIETDVGDSERIAFSTCEACPELADPRFRIENNLLVNVADTANSALYRYFASDDTEVSTTRLAKDFDPILLQNLVLDDNPATFDGVFTAYDGTVSPASDFTPAAGSILIDAGINLYDPETITLDIEGTERPNCGAPPCDSSTPAWDVGPIELPPP